VSLLTRSLGDLADDDTRDGQVGGTPTHPKGTAMHIVVGPVLTRKGGYAFDCWRPEQGLSLGYVYGRVEDANYARNVEIRSSKKRDSRETIACGTVDEFVRLTI
jgi:hypothetical protein